jgi:hypothetical protein
MIEIVNLDLYEHYIELTDMVVTAERYSDMKVKTQITPIKSEYPIREDDTVSYVYNIENRLEPLIDPTDAIPVGPGWISHWI